MQILWAEQTRVLCVIAHPDDEIAFAATVYKITQELHGSVDVLIITNGESGYKYSTLAEPIYCLKLTEEKIGREFLPFIRKREALNAGKIIGVHNYYFLDQPDPGYTQNIQEVFSGVWNVELIKEVIASYIAKENYDFIFTLLPDPETHGHHKAATLLALEVINSLDPCKRPVILAAGLPDKNNMAKTFLELPEYPLTKMQESSPVFSFNKRKPLGYLGRLNYQIVVNWFIAEHKSQGTTQLLMDKGDNEFFYYFMINADAGTSAAKKLFDQLAK